MSARAACRLESLGFTSVYDYAAGKVDWMAAGLPTVRADTTERRAIDAMEADAPTCGTEDLAGEVASHVSSGTVVVLDRGIVAGRLVVAGADDHGHRVHEVMELGPTTVRANEPLEPLLERMAKHHVHEMIVSTPEGQFLGVVRA